VKTHVQVYNARPEDKPFPLALIQARDLVLKYTISMMRVFGIAKLTAKHSVVGIKSLTGVSFQPFPLTPPPDLVAARNFVARTLAEQLTLFGILQVELVPEGTDLEILAKCWTPVEESITEVGPKDDEHTAVTEPEIVLKDSREEIQDGNSTE
jgi:hypothetical protein